MEPNPPTTTPDPRHRFTILRDPASIGTHLSPVDQTAQNRRALLATLAELTEAIATDPAGEGIDVAELGRIRSAALRLAAAADTAAEGPRR